MPHGEDDDLEALDMKGDDKSFWKKYLSFRKGASVLETTKVKEPVAKKKKKPVREKTLSEQMYEDPAMMRILASDQKKALK